MGVYSYTGRAQAAKVGRNFLGKGYSKAETGRWVSKDSFRQMRFDKTGHLRNGKPSKIHFNLETWKYKIASVKGNKRIGNIHKFFKGFRTWIE